MAKKLHSEKVLRSISKKNYLILCILFSQFLILIPCVKWIIKKYLTHCENREFSPGFKFLYGNIYAKNVHVVNTFFVDYAPIFIGENTRFGFDCICITSKHDREDFSKVIVEPIKIGKKCVISSRSIILQGVTIGDGAIIGAGSVVTHNIPANCLAAGNPAKIIRRFN